MKEDGKCLKEPLKIDSFIRDVNSLAKTCVSPRGKVVVDLTGRLVGERKEFGTTVKPDQNKISTSLPCPPRPSNTLNVTNPRFEDDHEMEERNGTQVFLFCLCVFLIVLWIGTAYAFLVARYDNGLISAFYMNLIFNLVTLYIFKR